MTSVGATASHGAILFIGSRKYALCSFCGDEADVYATQHIPGCKIEFSCRMPLPDCRIDPSMINQDIDKPPFRKEGEPRAVEEVKED